MMQQKCRACGELFESFKQTLRPICQNCNSENLKDFEFRSHIEQPKESQVIYTQSPYLNDRDRIAMSADSVVTILKYNFDKVRSLADDLGIEYNDSMSELDAFNFMQKMEIKLRYMYADEFLKEKERYEQENKDRKD